MIYFIPAWYQDKMWSEREQYWYVLRTRTEFDDTVKQIQLFHRNKVAEYRILLLGFSPNFRHFLHRQGVYHAPYWSCFDAICSVKRTKAAVFSFHNINWPDDIEFIYTPFVIMGYLHGKKYAQIEFGEDGNLIEIAMYENEVIVRRNIYDDRGFVGSTIVYEDGKPAYQDYLMENGIWKLRCFMKDGSVKVNSKYATYLLKVEGREKEIPFSNLEYENLEQIIGEVFHAFLVNTDEQDIFCLAMHDHHTELLAQNLNQRKTILSFFEDRFQIRYNPYLLGLLDSTGYVITDSKDNLNKINREVGKLIKNIIDITPYDSRMDKGISQQLKTQKILVPVDDMPEKEFVLLIQCLGEYLSIKDNCQVHLFTRVAGPSVETKLLNRVADSLKNANLNEAMALDLETESVIDGVDQQEKTKIRFFVEQCVDELTVSKCMKEQRLLVDMRKNPQVYLQITAISMGIPQIVTKQTQFVEHKRNGLVIDSIQELGDALSYYLDRLSNWNEAMVYSFDLGKQYTTEVLIEKWKEVISSFD